MLDAHPYTQVHYETRAGIIPVKPCRSVAIVVTNDPQQVTCPRCLKGLRRLSNFLCWLETADLENLEADTILTPEPP